MIVGVDEAGRGPLAGGVVACALFIKETINLPHRDSKMITHGVRERFFEHFRDKTVFSLGVASGREIDRHNILEATYFAFNRAISSLIKKAPQLEKAKFIIDGNRFWTPLDINYKCIVKADKKIREVAYASIVAKLFRDHLMGVADFLYPEWGFSKHKGYPTKEHLSLVKRLDISPLHRRSFFPCNLWKKESFTKKRQ